MELIGAMLDGALLLWAIGWIRNRQVTQNGSRKQSTASQPEQ
jgi:hypothetical protein